MYELPPIVGHSPLWFALSRPSPIRCRCRVQSVQPSGHFLPSFVHSFLPFERPTLLHMVAIKGQAPLLRDIYSHRYLLLVVSSFLPSINQPRLPCSFSVPGHRTSTIEVPLPWSWLSELLLFMASVIHVQISVSGFNTTFP